MSTTAEKLTYLNETKSKIKDNINLTGAGLTNQTPFRQYATDLKTALLNILNNGIDTLYNNFPKTTGTGTNITLNNTLQAPIRSVINGDTEQDGEPTPDNPKEIKSVTGLQTIDITGKNLLDDSKNTNNYYINASGNITPGENFAYTTLIPVEQTIYTFSSIQTALNLTNNKRIHGYDKNGNWIEQITYSTITTGNTSQDYSITFTINNSNIKYVRISYFKSDTNSQLEKGSTATTYEPYQGQEYEINLGNIHLYENDQIIGTPNNWSIKHVIGEVVLDGSENYFTMGWGTKYAYRTSINNLKLISGDEILDNKSNYYKNYATNQLSTLIVPNYGIANRINQSEIIIRNDDCSTASQLQTWLQTHNTKVVYELAEPTTTPITNTELIEDLNNFYNAKSYNGQTNISVDGDLPMILDVNAIIGD